MKKTFYFDDVVKQFIDSLGGISEVINKERKEIYNKFVDYCVYKNYRVVTSQLFTRTLNRLYDTQLKLVTRNCEVTYTIVKKEV